MDWKQFFAAIVSAIAWPLAIFGIAALFRRTIKSLLPTMRRVKYGDLQVDFEKEVEAIKAEAKEQNEDFSQLLVSEKTIQLAKLSPRAAILESWLDVEEAATKAAERHKLVVKAKPPYMPSMSVNALRDNNLINEGTQNMFNNLRLLRNEAVHASDRQISVQEAINISDMCKRIIARLDNA